MFIRALND
jgi:hypothetical protein